MFKLKTNPAKSFSVPSKTFILGEYAVLLGKPCVFVNTQPRFQMVIKEGSGQFKNMDERACLWIKKKASHFKNFDFEFQNDCFSGGLGASSAQFLILHQWMKKTKAQELLEDYKTQTTQDHRSKFSPSGADLMAQFSGGLGVYRPKPFSLETLGWPFKEYSFMILRTSYKINTYEHLQNLKVLSSCFSNNLSVLIEKSIEGFKKEDIFLFCESLKQFYKNLLLEGLVCEMTEALIEEFQRSCLFLASKGCGALGADTVFCVFRKEKAKDVKEWLRKKDLRFIASEEHISEGLKEL